MVLFEEGILPDRKTWPDLIWTFAGMSSDRILLLVGVNTVTTVTVYGIDFNIFFSSHTENYLIENHFETVLSSYQYL